MSGDHVQVGGRTISLETSERKTPSSKGDGRERKSDLNRGILEKAAVGLIDVAANFLKSGVQIGTKSSRAVRQ